MMARPRSPAPEPSSALVMIPGMSRATLHHRYSLLLGLILLTLAVQLAAPDGDAARFVAVALQAVVLIVAVVTSRAHRWVVRLTIGACVVIVLGAAAALFGTDELGEDASHVVSFLLVALTPPVIINGLVQHFRDEHSITRETMFGVLCIYLLIGMLFSAAFGVAQAVSGDDFFDSGPGVTADYLYFSFATLTTTGYGDLIAATNLGRSLAITEALIGQIYLVTVVALIVGNVRGLTAPAPEHEDRR